MSVPLPIIANTFRCALKWINTGGSQSAVNVIHVQANTAGQHASDAFAAIDAHVSANMWVSAVAGASVTEVDITPLDGVSATQSFSTGSPAKWSGSAGGDYVPQVAVLIKLFTGLRGRQNRGRVYLPFTAETGISDGLLVATGVINAAWVAFQAGMVGMAPVEWGLCVASYDRAHAGVGAHATGITGLLCEQVLGTQRRRQGRLRGS
jgi:hypothetical protein